MARCRCSEETCVCQLAGGEGVVVEGNGSASSPWLVSAPPSARGAVIMQDSPTIIFTQSGVGEAAEPYLIHGDVYLSPALTFVDDEHMDFTVTGEGTDLSPMLVHAKVTCLDCAADGSPGDVLTLQADGTYSPGPPAIVPAGTIFATTGIVGDGTVATPLRLDLCTYADLKALCVP